MRAVVVLILGIFSLNLASAQVSVTTASGTHAPRGPFRPGQLIFEDTFEELNHERWEHELTLSGGGNWEFQWYVNERENSYIENNTLHIAPTFTSEEFGEAFLSSGTAKIWGGAPADYCTNNDWWGCERAGNGNNYINPIKSARLRTVKSFAFKYGIVETRAKIPRGDWLWPAIWMMPKHNAYSGWPRSGEIDIMESRGNELLFDANDPNRNVGVREVSSTLHFGPYWNQNGYEFASFHQSNEHVNGFNEDFHIYRVGWTPEHIQFSVDGVVTGTINITEVGSFWELGRFDERFDPPRFNPWQRQGATQMAPFDQEFYLIINLAVGGTNGFFYDGLNNLNGNKPWSNDSPTAFRDFWQGRSQWEPSWGRGVDDRSHLQVDYVRVFAV